MAIQNRDTYKFSEAEQDWDLGRLFGDIEAKQLKKVTPAQQRNLKALLLGLSPKDVSPILNIEEKSLKPAFSALYRLIEDLSDQPEKSVNHRNVPLVLAKYRKGATIAIDKKFDLLGREVDRQKLEEFIKQYKIVLIKAGAGVGKSTLAREFLQTQFKKVIRIEMGLESGNVTPAEEKVSQILRKDFDEEPSRDFGINLDILREKLADRANPIGVLIDNLEPALDENYRFREKLRGYDALLAVLGDRDVFSFTLITSRRSLITSRARVNEYSLEGLDITAWRQYFYDCENGADSEALVQMRDAYNGNAKVMDILHGAIKNRFYGDIGAYWSRYKDALLADSELETLISMEMDWLRDNQPDAYKLLCRMGCYRYQDVKTVPFEGLICLLWDIPESRQSWVVDYLSKSSLIEFKGEYYLHPAMHKAAKSSLLQNEIDWETANIKAAEFWQSCINSTIKSYNDAIRTIESFEHYYSIQKWEKAFFIWKNNIHLGRFGGALALNNQQEKLSSKLSLSPLEEGDKSIFLGINLYHLSKYSEAIQLLSLDKQLFQNNKIVAIEWLCACYLDTGKSKLVIDYGDYAIDAGKQLKYKSQIHLLNLIGASHCNLCDYETSIINHNLALDIATKECYKTQIGYSLAYIAYCRFSQMEFFQNFPKSEINEIGSILKKAIDIFNEVGDKASEVISKCYLAKLYLYKAEPILARQCYESANVINEELSQKTSFSSPYLRNILLSTLGKFNFMNCQYTESIDLLKQSIILCKGMKANFFLAEAYFQLGLTYQAMGEYDQAEEYKAKALELFEQMEAPKQIERVNKAFGDNIQ